MKTETFRKLNAHSLAITVFFAGIIISCGSLYLLCKGVMPEALVPTALLIGGTFLTGIVSVSLIARNGNGKVIYLEKKIARELVKRQETDVAKGKISEEVLGKLSASGQYWLNELCGQVDAAQGALYVVDNANLRLEYGYAVPRDKTGAVYYGFGEGLVGRVAVEKNTLRIDPLPDGYITVFSGLGAASPRHLVMVPVKTENNIAGVLEIATFSPLDEVTLRQIEASSVQLALHLTPNLN